jgi:hypothetical protein
MAQPRRRRLWYAFIDNIDEVFFVNCTVHVDTITDVKRMICEQVPECKVAYWKLHLYSPVHAILDNWTIDDLTLLRPRQQISDDFPQSCPDLDILIVLPQAHQIYRYPRQDYAPESIIPCAVTNSDTSVRVARTCTRPKYMHSGPNCVEAGRDG